MKLLTVEVAWDIFQQVAAPLLIQIAQSNQNNWKTKRIPLSSPSILRSLSSFLLGYLFRVATEELG